MQYSYYIYVLNPYDCGLVSNDESPASTSNGGGAPLTAGEWIAPQKTPKNQSRGEQSLTTWTQTEWVRLRHPLAQGGLVLWDVDDMYKDKCMAVRFVTENNTPGRIRPPPFGYLYSRRRKETFRPLEMLSAAKCLLQLTFRGCDNRSSRGNVGGRKHPAMLLNTRYTVVYGWRSAHSSRGSA